MASQPPSPDSGSQIQQDLQGDRNQAIGQVYGGIVVYVSGGQAIINPAAADLPASAASPTVDIGPNPYKGLLSFHEEDCANFFGRSRDIQRLWEQFRDLQNAEVRLLPVYGPSGSGKSSLVRAGLIPELGQHPPSGRDRARVAVLVPGTQPLQALATVLARIAENDPTPVKKTREFAEELGLANQAGQYDGLQRIASALPEIGTVPLIVLVDQFEEVYSLCKDEIARDAMIANLLHAARDRSRYVSVVLTMRSDFLGETQKPPALNWVFSAQGFLVPTMDGDCLWEAIAQPAKQAGQPFDVATVNLLIQQTEGREGALPLLQFALTRIWEGLRQGETPAVTLERIGGVGGGLAGEAQRIYERLNAADQQIARRIFLGLVQLGDVIKYTRRRAVITSLVSPLDTVERVKQIIGWFADREGRLITLSAHADGEMAEITHEALFDHWQALQNWLEDNRLFLTWQDRLRTTMRQWEMNDREPEALIRGKLLDEAEEWLQKQKTDLSQIEQAYIQASLEERDRLQKAEKDRQQREYDLLNKFVRTARIRTRLAISVAGLAIAALTVVGFSLWQQQQSRKTIEAVFLGTDPHEILSTLPQLHEQANSFRRRVDKLPDTEGSQAAISYYQKNRQAINRLFAYYRSILTTSHQLQLTIERQPGKFPNHAKEKIRKEVAMPAEASLAQLIYKYRIPELKLYLDRHEFGNRRPNSIGLTH